MPFIALALGVWVAGVATARLTTSAALEPRPPWQHSFLQLDEQGQRFYRSLREGIFEAENLRASTGHWPAPAELADAGIGPFNTSTWALAQQRPYINYSSENNGLRWLVLFIEPEGSEGAPAQPDEEHHTLSTGLGLHVTVWTQPVSEPRPLGVLSFPVAEGWVQRVGQ
jgi:hypothetical protein